jgi:pyruvate/2-oxoglutarate dehydrogenase complex dihydrolipoamide acyltransferase (E2) component
MPDLSTISSTVSVVRWLVEAGQHVRRGEPLLEVETDKSTLVVESPITGVLRAPIAQPGQVVPAGDVIATFESDDTPPDDAPAPAPAATAPEPARHAEPARPAAPPARGGSFFARNRRAAGPDDAPEAPES